MLIELIFIAWVIKVVIDRWPSQNYTKEDAERFWGCKFDDGQDSFEVTKPRSTFLSRFKRPPFS